MHFLQIRLIMFSNLIAITISTSLLYISTTFLEISRPKVVVVQTPFFLLFNHIVSARCRPFFHAYSL